MPAEHPVYDVSDEILRQVIKYSPQAIAVLDRDLRYLIHSDRWIEDYRLEGQSIVGRHHYEVFPEVPDRWKAIHQRCLAGAIENSDEDSFIRLDGRREWVRWDCRPWRDPDGNVAGLLFLTEVNTAKKEIEEQLKRTHEQLLEAQRIARVGYWEWDPQDDTVRMSGDVFADVTGHEAPSRMDELLELVAADDRDELRQKLGLASRAQNPFSLEYRIVDPNGRDLWLHARGRHAPGSEGRPGLIVGAFQDVSDQRQLESQFRQAQKMEAVGRLAGGVAHDFNNLLTAIMNFTRFALEDVAPEGTAHEDLTEVLKAAERAARLTKQLLAFSREQAVRPQVVNVSEQVLSVDRMLRRVIGEDILYSNELAEHIRNTRIDPIALEQVVVNLVINSRDAMPTGGSLTIRTSNVTLEESRVSADGQRLRPGDYVSLSVSDTGSGMSPETVRRSIEPFFTTKEAGKGTGLGLSTCYGIAQQAGGQLTISSELGAGTTVTVLLPSVAEDVGETQLRPPVRQLGGNETILLAEDDPQVRSLVTRALERRGYTVLAAESGEAALRDFGERLNAIDLLLSDVVMPNLNGKELADRIRARNPDLRVLFMSGYNPGVVSEHGLAQEDICMVKKPFTPSELLGQVRGVLEAAPGKR